MNQGIETFSPANNLTDRRVFIYGAGQGGSIVSAALQMIHQNLSVRFIQTESDPINPNILALSEYLEQERAGDVIILALQAAIEVFQELKARSSVAEIQDATPYIQYMMKVVPTRNQFYEQPINCMNKVANNLSEHFSDIFSKKSIDKELSNSIEILSQRGKILGDMPISQSISMLHPFTLAVLGFVTRMSNNTILEIGSYVGGSTIAVLDAMNGEERNFHIVESGGKHLSHPTIPTDDILRDLHLNLKKNGYEGEVVVHQHLAEAGERNEETIKDIGSEQVGLLIYDANVNFKEVFETYLPCLRSPCFVVVDDLMINPYDSVIDKSYSAWNDIDELKSKGSLYNLALVDSGTWFGLYIPNRYAT